MRTSLDISRAARLRPIGEVAAELGLAFEDLEPYGVAVAKIATGALRRPPARPPGRLVVVTAITPTGRGEGKTTLSIGLVDALRRLGVRAVATLRQPSLGPVFGLKGGGGGGGRAQVVPMERLNLHLTGDFHAVTSAHNLAAALVDNHLNHGNALGIEPGSVSWPRALDVNDRTLRDVVVGLGGRANGPVRETGFVITAASEVMAALALSDDLADLRRRLGRIVVGRRRDGAPVSLEELRAAGAMAALLSDASRPNLLQTLEGSPVLIHAGPFGNVSQGASSVAADRLALGLADVVVTEAGFGAELGAEKLFDIKCRQSGLVPAAAVMVATVRALRRHGGSTRAAGAEDVEAVRRGGENLVRQLAVLGAFGVPAVVAVNRFPEDAPAEVEAVREIALGAGARAAVAASPFSDGGEGALDLARAVLEVSRGLPSGADAREGLSSGANAREGLSSGANAREGLSSGANAREGATFRLLYDDALPLAEKIETLATRLYGAAAVEYSHTAAGQLEELERLGFGRLPICTAKTHLSMSHDPLLGPTPRGYRFPVRELRLAAGAGFVTAVAGDMQLMPGLPAQPAADVIDVDAEGCVTGLR